MKREISWLRRTIEAEAHHHLGIASAVALGVLATTLRVVDWRLAFIFSWDVFAFTSLILAWGGMLVCDTKSRVKEATLEDSSRAVIAASLIVAAFASLAGAAFLLHTAKDLKGGDLAGHVTLAAVTIVFSWLLVHTLLAVRYTHLFYANPDDTPVSSTGKGLDFPNEVEPDFPDFAYFSFVIGMTFQVSDVEVTSRQMRRLVLFHSLLSFAFNTVIVAFSINLATTLL
jgi:uncharacterized membrane protein